MKAADQILNELADLDQAIAAFSSVEVEEFSAAWLTHASLARRREVLQEELSTALSGQQRPVLQFLFQGAVALGDTVRVDLLGRTVTSLQDAVYAAAQALVGEPTNRGTIPMSIRRQASLWASGVARGSFGLVMQGSDSAVQEELFDEPRASLLERSVSRILDIADLATAEELDDRLLNALGDLGDRFVGHLSVLCSTLASNQADVKMVWESPLQAHREVSLPHSNAEALSKYLSDIAVEVRYDYVSGRLMGLSLLHDRFELVRDDGQEVKGTIDPDLHQRIVSYLVHECRARLEVTVTRSQATGKKVESFRLVDIGEP